jgi:pyrroline-5-carboxylate reductase
VFCVAAGSDSKAKATAEDLLAPLGDVIELDEGLIDAATAIMGCSPGYLALMAEVLVEEGVKLGLTEEASRRMTARAMAATGGLIADQDPAELKQAVASPGGMTEAGLEALEDKGLRDALTAAVDASVKRAEELGK